MHAKIIEHTPHYTVSWLASTSVLRPLRLEGHRSISHGNACHAGYRTNFLFLRSLCGNSSRSSQMPFQQCWTPFRVVANVPLSCGRAGPSEEVSLASGNVCWVVVALLWAPATSRVRLLTLHRGHSPEILLDKTIIGPAFDVMYVG